MKHAARKWIAWAGLIFSLLAVIAINGGAWFLEQALMGPVNAYIRDRTLAFLQEKSVEGLLITFPHEPDSWVKLVIDPATSLVRSEGNLKGVTIIQKAQWTNRLPRIIPPPPKYACGR